MARREIRSSIFPPSHGCSVDSNPFSFCAPYCSINIDSSTHGAKGGPIYNTGAWYFLAAYQFLKVAEKLSVLGNWAPKLVGVLGQALAILLLFSVPFIDRGPDRHPSKRKLAILAGICGVILFIVFTIWGKYS